MVIADRVSKTCTRKSNRNSSNCFIRSSRSGVFDRSAPLPGGGFIEQADGTGWMAMYCLNLLTIALELAREDSAYEDVASKFWEHFLFIAHAINHLGEDHEAMWDEDRRLFLRRHALPGGNQVPMKVRSAVGLIPLFAVETLELRLIDRFPGFKRRMEWFIANRRDLTLNVASMVVPGLWRAAPALPRSPPSYFPSWRACWTRRVPSPFGVRSVSRFHKDHPYVLATDGQEHRGIT